MKDALRVRWEWVVALSLMIVGTSWASVEEKPWSRAYRSDLYAIVQILGEDKVSALHDSGDVAFETTPVYGVGMGFNFSEHLNVNTEIMLGWADVEEDSPYWEAPLEHDGDSVYLWNVNVDYYFLKGRLTPLVSAGGGILGYNGEDRLHEVHFAGNVGAGIRWDMTDHFALRVMYRSTWWEIENGDDPFQFEGVTASFIYTFK